MKKVLILLMSIALAVPSMSASIGDRLDDLPVKPKSQKSGIHFKVRRHQLKGPKAKNQRAWNDRSERRPVEVGTVRRQNRKGAKGFASAGS